MNVQTIESRPQTRTAATKQAIADCDVHPTWKPGGLDRYLSSRWREHMKMFNVIMRQGPDILYPKGQPDAARRDAWPEDGSRPGSDLELMRRQHLDYNNVKLGIMNPLRGGPGMLHDDFAAAFATAVNDWQVEEWASKEPRLKASVSISSENTEAAVAEIDRRAGDPLFRQVIMLSRTPEPLGSRRYWPIYEAAQRANLPVGIHAFGASGFPVTGGGWPSYYIEDMVNHAAACQSGLASLVLEGAFERFPKLKIVMIEAGFAWAPALAWRLDKIWKRLSVENPMLKRLPSEYLRDHVWYTTQPMEEPNTPEHLRATMEWIGWNRMMFATDYPHWDFDDPAYVLPLRINDDLKQKFFIENAVSVYGEP